MTGKEAETKAFAEWVKTHSKAAKEAKRGEIMPHCFKCSTKSCTHTGEPRKHSWKCDKYTPNPERVNVSRSSNCEECKTLCSMVGHPMTIVCDKFTKQELR